MMQCRVSYDTGIDITHLYLLPLMLTGNPVVVAPELQDECGDTSHLLLISLYTRYSKLAFPLCSVALF